jgi:hypothetical protein
MSVSWIVHFDFGNIAISAERSGSAVRQSHNDQKIINAPEGAFNFWTGSRTHRHRNGIRWTASSATPTATAATAAGLSAKPRVLQLGGVRIPGSDSLKISGHGMTRTAVLYKVRLTRRRVADQHIELDWRAPRGGALPLRCGNDAVDVFGDGFNIVRSESELRHRGHPGITAAILNHRPDQLSGLIVENNCRPQQIRPALVAAA